MFQILKLCIEKFLKLKNCVLNKLLYLFTLNQFHLLSYNLSQLLFPIENAATALNYLGLDLGETGRLWYRMLMMSHLFEKLFLIYKHPQDCPHLQFHYVQLK